MSRHLIVIGAGIAGSSAARVARDLGWTATVIDPAPERAASRAALATIRPSWFDKAGRAAAARSWEWYDRWGAAITQTATVTDWRNPDPKRQTGWWMVDPILPLVTPDVRDIVADVRDRAVTLSNGHVLTADAVLQATGATTLPPGSTPLPGATLVSRNARLHGGPLRIHHLRPYHTLTVGQIGETVRLGSSAHRDQTRASEEVGHMLHAAEQAGIVDPGAEWHLVTGTRARQPRNTPILPEPGNPNGVIGALARSGYALAPDAAHVWLESLT